MKMNILGLIRTGKTFKYISSFVAISIFMECVSPSVALALTSGPAQEEFASFEPATTTDMVDLYSGDFTYNIPLLSVPGPNGGYPINLAYHSGVSMEQEASWVGLGWNLNVGAINRQLRGLPDDFQNDEVTHRMNLRDNTTIALNVDLAQKKENFGKEKKTLSSKLNCQVYYNTYKGLGYRVFADFNLGREGKNTTTSTNVGISYDSQEGIGIEMGLSLKEQHGKIGLGYALGASYNSRQGLEEFSLSSSLSADKGAKTNTKKTHSGKKVTRTSNYHLAGNSTLSFSTRQSVPSVSIPMETNAVPFEFKFGKVDLFGSFKSKFPLAWSGMVSVSKVAEDGLIKSNA